VVVAQALPVLKEEEFFDIEWRKSQKNLLYYLTHYVLIQDRVEQEISSWQPWAHLLQLVNLVQKWYDTHPREPLYIIVFKSRQVGASTTLSGIANWLITFNSHTKGILQSKGAIEANEMLSRSRYINQHHPDFLRLKAQPDQDDTMGFNATESILIALPSTEDAGRSTDATFIFNDEWEKHKNAKESFAAMKPAMAKGGLFIGATTVNKIDMESFPKLIWEEAKRGVNGFIPLFWDYFVVPGRTEQTYQRDIKGIPEWLAEQEFPRNEKEALSAPKTLNYFQYEILEKYLQRCRDPLETRYGGIVRIWRPAITNRKDVFAVDPSEGQDDPSVGIIGDAVEDKACYYGKISLDEQAKIIFGLYNEYNQPLMAVERNASGLTLIEKLKNLGVTNWYYGIEDKGKKKPGFWTGPNRKLILTQYAESVRLQQREMPIKDCIEQHYFFAEINGKAQAVRGKHDDWVMCEAILGQGLKMNQRGDVGMGTVKYRG